MPARPTVAITGASGYVGGVLVAACAAREWPTVGLVRSGVGGGMGDGVGVGVGVAVGEDGTLRPYALDAPLDPGLLGGVDVLIHCAYDLRVTKEADIWRINVEGTGSLLELARRTGVSRTIVVSSMSAYTGTAQLYGRSKLDIEALAGAAGAVVVRPGLVYGPDAGGMAGTLASLSGLPLVPVVAGRSHQYTVHQDDLATAILALAVAPEAPTVPVGLANPHPVPFRQVVEGLARMNGRRVRTVPVDWHLVHAGLRLCERAGIAVPFRSDSLLGLVRSAPSVPGLEVLDALGVTLRRFEQPVPDIS
jgi:nucleoside-diphosphate-sugar epimerase